MTENIESLYTKFKEIKKLNWIKTKRIGNGGIGYTFETMLGKREENFPIPDYNNIEIKTSRTNSWGKIHLFHATPDGDFLFPIKDILNTLGYPDKESQMEILKAKAKGNPRRWFLEGRRDVPSSPCSSS